MSQSKPNTNQSDADKLFYTTANTPESLVFAPPDKAEYISAIHHALQAATWGEFKARIPTEEYKRLLKEWESDLDDDDNLKLELPSDDDSFHPEYWVPGWSDGDYPDWLQKDQDLWLPKSILERFARFESSAINGPFWIIDPVFEKDIVEELRREGFSVTRRDDLTFY
jgi:hypothetical protein